jgi:hypothetical protein
MLPCKEPISADLRTYPATAPNPPQSPLRLSVPPHAPYGRWATRAGRSPGSRLKRPVPAFPKVRMRTVSGNLEQGSPLTVAGAAAALDEMSEPRSLFTHRCHVAAPARTVTQGQRGRVSTGESIGCDEVPGSVPRMTQILLNGSLDDGREKLVDLAQRCTRFLVGRLRERPIADDDLARR